MCIQKKLPPFEIPDTWEWIRVGSIFQHNTGKALNSSNRNGKLLEYITTSNLYWNKFELKNLKQMYFNESELDKCTVSNGDLLVCEGGDFGRAAIWDFNYSMCIQNHIHKLRPFAPLCIKFFYYLFYFYKNSGLIGGRGIGIQGLSSNALHSLLFPFPPFEEQIRIVAKIEEILPHIDEYESKELERNTLNLNFPEQLKKSILQEAVQGKLIPQDPSDEPASALLERIREVKTRLVKEGKIKKDKNESVIFRRDNSYYEKSNDIERCIDEEIPFAIPDSWEWVRLKKLGISQTGNTPSKNHPEYFGGFIPFIGPGDIIEYGINTNNKGLSRIGLEFGRLAIAGSILQVCIGGSIGKAAINHVDMAFNQQINSITPIECNEEFLFCTMISPYFVKTIKERAGGTATPIINRGEWDNILVPVAPIREQSRIVKTIESILKCFNISLGITNQ